MLVGSFAPSFVRRDKVLNIFPNTNIYSVVTYFYLPFFLPSFFFPSYLSSNFSILFPVPIFSRVFFISSFFLSLLSFLPPLFSYPLCVSSSFSVQNISRLMMFMKQCCLPLKQTHTCLVGEACITILVLHTITTARRRCVSDVTNFYILYIHIYKIKWFTYENYLRKTQQKYTRKRCVFIKCNHANTKNTKIDLMKRNNRNTNWESYYW